MYNGIMYHMKDLRFQKMIKIEDFKRLSGFIVNFCSNWIKNLKKIIFDIVFDGMVDICPSSKLNKCQI